MKIEADIAMYEFKEIIKRSADRAAASKAKADKAKRNDDIAYVVATIGLIILAMWALPKFNATEATAARVMQEASVKW